MGWIGWWRDVWSWGDSTGRCEPRSGKVTERGERCVSSAKSGWVGVEQCGVGAGACDQGGSPRVLEQAGEGAGHGAW